MDLNVIARLYVTLYECAVEEPALPSYGCQQGPDTTAQFEEELVEFNTQSNTNSLSSRGR